MEVIGAILGIVMAISLAITFSVHRLKKSNDIGDSTSNFEDITRNYRMINQANNVKKREFAMYEYNIKNRWTK